MLESSDKNLFRRKTQIKFSRHIKNFLKHSASCKIVTIIFSKHNKKAG